MPTYHLYPFYSDESATVYNEPIISIEADQPPTEITEPMLREMLINLGSDEETVKGLSYQEMADKVWETHTLILDSCAVIVDEGEVVSYLDHIGTTLMEPCGSDSCWYHASEVFSQILVDYAVSVIDFPFPSEEVL